ncbi:Sarcoma antigen 1, partial [Plecturocebus cupreus]
MSMKIRCKMANRNLITSCKQFYLGLLIWKPMLDCPTWFSYVCIMSSREEDNATVTHNVCEEKINNGHPAPDNFLPTITRVLINLSGAGIPPTNSTANHSVPEEKVEDGQPAPDNILSAILQGLINMEGAGIPAMNTNDLCMFAYATITHNVGKKTIKTANQHRITCCPLLHQGLLIWQELFNLFIWFPDASITHNVCEEKVQKVQRAPYNFLSTVASGLINMAGADATTSHNVHKKKMNNDQKAPDNSSSAVPPGHIKLSRAGTSSRSATVIHGIQKEEIENGQTPFDGFLPDSAPPELINMKGEYMPPNPLDSFSYNFTSLSKDKLLYKPDSNKSVVGTQNYSVSANYERIFILLEEVQGSLKVKRQFVEFTIKEAA